MNPALIVKIRRSYSLAFGRLSSSRQDELNPRYSSTLYKRRSFSHDDFFVSYADNNESTSQNDAVESASQRV